MDAQEPWVGVEEVAAHLDVNRQTIYRWIGKRGLPARKVGRIFRFKLSEVDEWMRTGGGSSESGGEDSSLASPDDSGKRGKQK